MARFSRSRSSIKMATICSVDITKVNCISRLTLGYDSRPGRPMRRQLPRAGATIGGEAVGIAGRRIRGASIRSTLDRSPVPWREAGEVAIVLTVASVQRILLR